MLIFPPPPLLRLVSNLVGIWNLGLVIDLILSSSEGSVTGKIELYPHLMSVIISFDAGPACCGEKSAELQVKVDREAESEAWGSGSSNYPGTNHSGKHGGEHILLIIILI